MLLLPYQSGFSKNIYHNGQKKTKEKSNFEKDLYEVMNEASFCKTLEM